MYIEIKGKCLISFFRFSIQVTGTVPPPPICTHPSYAATICGTHPLTQFILITTHHLSYTAARMFIPQEWLYRRGFTVYRDGTEAMAFHIDTWHAGAYQRLKRVLVSYKFKDRVGWSSRLLPSTHLNGAISLDI